MSEVLGSCNVCGVGVFVSVADGQMPDEMDFLHESCRAREAVKICARRSCERPIKPPRQKFCSDRCARLSHRASLRFHPDARRDERGYTLDGIRVFRFTKPIPPRSHEFHIASIEDGWAIFFTRGSGLPMIVMSSGSLETIERKFPMISNGWSA